MLLCEAFRTFRFLRVLSSAGRDVNLMGWVKGNHSMGRIEGKKKKKKRNRLWEMLINSRLCDKVII